ncbi:hypothetical protein Tco_0418237 [Tanacetum coccineum]
MPLPKDPYEAIRQAYLDGKDIESEPFEDPIDTKTLETARMAVCVPYAMSSVLSASMAYMAAMFEFALRKQFRSSYESSPSVLPPDLPSRKRYREDDGPTAKDEDPAVEDEGLTVGVEGPGMHDEGYGLVDERHGRDDKSHGIDDEGYSIESDRLGLRYEALRCRELALEEGDVYSTFETDPEDGMIYIDIPDYPPPAPPVQTPPSPEWTSGSLSISPSHSDVPSPISSPMVPLTVPSPIATPTTAETEGFLAKLGAQVEMQGGLISDHAVQLEELSPALFKRYDRDIG